MTSFLFSSIHTGLYWPTILALNSLVTFRHRLNFQIYFSQKFDLFFKVIQQKLEFINGKVYLPAGFFMKFRMLLSSIFNSMNFRQFENTDSYILYVQLNDNQYIQLGALYFPIYDTCADHEFNWKFG